MIGYSGYFGAGKTLNMTKDLYDAHKKGAFVITNYKCSFSNLVLKSQAEVLQCFREILSLRYSGRHIPDLQKEVEEYFNKNFPQIVKDTKSGKLGEFFTNKKSFFHRVIYIGLDEAGVYFNSRNYKEWEAFPEIMDFLLQCRKLNVEIFYTVQYPAFVDVNFRRLTTEWAVLSRLPIFPIVRKEIMVIPPENPNYKSGDVVNSSLRWGGKSKVWDMYDTTELCFKHGGKFVDSFPLLLSSNVFDRESEALASPQKEEKPKNKFFPNQGIAT